MSSSEEEEEGYLLIKYGSAMEELDEPDIAKKPIAVHEQIVTDEQGRRRFHGAFTGGFSAGYYNTVDTPEGWTPSSFRSTRHERKANEVFVPEDFMDDEDMAEHGIAPNKIVPQSSFAMSKDPDDKNLKRKENFAKNATMLLGLNMLQSLVIPVSNNIGVHLLQLMGWKPGQGIGPKVKRPKKNAFMPENVEFAPQDCVPMVFTPKDNAFGLGYTGMDPKRALHNKVKKSSAIAIRTKSGAKLSFAGQAFGVGAFEEDDGDIYAQDSMANYDLIINDEKHDESYGWSKPKKAITSGNFAQSIEYIKKELENFKKAEKSTRRKFFAPPILPPDYDPNRRLNALGKFGGGTGASQGQNVLTEEEERDKKFERLGPKERGKMLGEKESQPSDFDKDSSIFTLLKPKDRQRLQIQRHGGIGQPLPPRKAKKRSIHEPFAEIPAKQTRYEDYLKHLKNKEIDPYTQIEHDPNMTEWECEQEREEFIKSSRFFQPLSATMSSRFAPESEVLKLENAKEEEQKEAVKMKMFGIMTRDNFEWHPDRLLCKRFNVPNPYPHSDIIGIPGRDDSSHGELFLHPDDFKSKPKLQAATAGTNTTGILSDTKNPPLLARLTSKPSRWDKEPTEQLALPNVASESQVGQPDVNENPDNMEVDTGAKEGDSSDSDEEEAKPSRPSMDLFKAIFANSDDSSSSEDEGEVEILTRSSKTTKKNDFKGAKSGDYSSGNSLSDPAQDGQNGVDETSNVTAEVGSNMNPLHKFSRPRVSDDKIKETGATGQTPDVNQPQFHKFTRSGGNVGSDKETGSVGPDEDDPDVTEPSFHNLSRSGGTLGSCKETGFKDPESSNVNHPTFHKFSRSDAGDGDGSKIGPQSGPPTSINQPHFHKFLSKKDRSTVDRPPTPENSYSASQDDGFAPQMPPEESFGPMLPPVKVPKLWESIEPESLKGKKAKKTKHKKNKHKKEKQKKKK